MLQSMDRTGQSWYRELLDHEEHLGYLASKKWSASGKPEISVVWDLNFAARPFAELGEKASRIVPRAESLDP